MNEETARDVVLMVLRHEGCTCDPIITLMEHGATWGTADIQHDPFCWTVLRDQAENN